MPAGSIVVLSAEPSEGHWFAGWDGDVREGGRETTVVVDRDTLVRAVFRSDQSALVSQFQLPWPAGERYSVSQGHGGFATHMASFGWDFPMPVGTPVLSGTAGVVVDLRDRVAGSSEDDLGESPPENFVAIDHGGGLKSIYVHLDFQGVVVSIGQRVTTGQVIGNSGNTGFSTAPHLHYEVRD
ncbi:MAG: M23 family metallopeptidase, partial [Planctomycetes bacterium]|nr:M23 family metallopeptidase [Planctomycetota bacterium]